MKCAVKKCENHALVAYGSNWLCGDCMWKVMEKERKEKDKRVEDLEI